MPIKIKSLEHHNFYIRYRLHTVNAGVLPASLQEFLTGIFNAVPRELFIHPENPGCSGLRLDLTIAMEQTASHPIINFAQKSREHTKFKNRHENLQQWFLLNDPQAIAAEVPVWMDEEESKKHLELSHPLTGHIDLLRYNGSKIEIWDYKPKASKEKWARVQVLFYALLLSIRAKIPLENILCGYFDESVAFTFRPLNIPFCPHTPAAI
ncbi:MAG: PD-(D/E)XK nuclease family protein [Chitinivibrionales bacterium]|nr:PD-(D/E)XK nuclease family protein [Chitinivibrionales bacterium]